MLNEPQRHAIQLENQFRFHVTIYRARDYHPSPFKMILKCLGSNGHAKTIYRNPRTKAYTIKVMLKTPELRDMMAEYLHETFPHISVSDRPRKSYRRKATIGSGKGSFQPRLKSQPR